MESLTPGPELENSLGHPRRFGDVGDGSAYHPITDVRRETANRRNGPSQADIRRCGWHVLSVPDLPIATHADYQGLASSSPL